MLLLVFGSIIECFFHGFYALMIQNISVKCFYFGCHTSFDLFIKPS